MPLPRFLIASADAEAVEALRSLFHGEARIVVEADAAVAARMLEDEAFQRLIVDTRVAGALALASRYLERTARGRAVALASLADPNTLLRIGVGAERLDVVFHPWNEAELRTCVLGPVPETHTTAATV